MRKANAGGVTVGVGLVLLGALAMAAPSRPLAPKPPTRDTDVYATVGPLAVTREDFNRRWSEAQGEYRERTGADISSDYAPTARRQVLEQLVRRLVLTLEARRLGVTATPAEAELMLRADPRFRTDNRFDPVRYQEFKTQQPLEFQRALNEVVATGGARKLYEQMDRETRPGDDEVRSTDIRRLSEAQLEYLPLYRTSFDGNYPEPTESEVIAEYQRHAGERMLPEEFVFAVVHVDQPPLPDSLAIRIDQREAWLARRRRSGDSLLTALHGGASLERLAAPYHGVERVSATRGAPVPAWWRGTADELSECFALAPGHWLGHPVNAETGPVVILLESKRPPRPAPLSQVAIPIRERLRRDSRLYRDDRAIEAIWQAQGERLRGPANAVMYAVADTSTFPMHQPTLEAMQAFYEAHVTDYSGLATDPDESGGSVKTLSFSQAKPDVYVRMVNEGRTKDLQQAIGKVADAWREGRRDAGAERALTRVVDAGIVPRGGRVDSSLAGLALSDSLAAGGSTPGVHIFDFKRGVIVAKIGPVIPDFMPSIAQIRPRLEAQLAQARDLESRDGAHALYMHEPGLFRKDRVYYMGRLILPLPHPLDVPVSRAEVEAAYRDHIADYSSPERVRIRHILIVPRDASPAADAAARARADSVMARVRAGEDFAVLARAYSDDPASRDNGGDLGFFEHGQMLAEIERPAFAMRPGDLAGPIRSPIGYHVMRCIEHIDAVSTPLVYCYPNVAWQIMKTRQVLIATERADSLRRFLHTPAEARAWGKRNHCAVMSETHAKGERVLPDIAPFFAAIERCAPGHVADVVGSYSGLGAAVGWVDSIADNHLPPYGDVEPLALDLWHKRASERVLRMKWAELDSMGRAGWSLDSLGALYGGLTRQDMAGPGKPIKDLGSAWLTDSLVFGSASRSPGLEVGQETGWLEFQNGMARLRLAQRDEPDPSQLMMRAPQTRASIQEYRTRARFAELEKRFPVQILDPSLAATPLPSVLAP